MKGEKTEELVRWKQLIEDATVTTFQVSTKSLAAQIFSFQNDRGKDLTNVEKVKAFLIYQVYMACSSGDPENEIKYVERDFSNIYQRMEELIDLDADHILSYYTTAFHGGWKKSPLDTVKGAFARDQDKLGFIKKFSTQLGEIFGYVKDIQRLARDNNPVGDVLLLDASDSWPLLLKIYHFHRDAPNVLEALFGLMEKILFKYHYGANGYRTNEFPPEAGAYAGDSKGLSDKLSCWLKSGFKEYWDFTGNFELALSGSHHYFPLTRYLLWKYENSLRRNEPPISYDDYCNNYGNHRWDQTLDHVAPQNPVGGSEGYSDNFRSRYLHNIGNLVLMTCSKNSHENNKPPIQKKDDYLTSTLLSQQEIGNTIARAGGWSEREIEARQRKVMAFARDRYKS